MRVKLIVSDTEGVAHTSTGCYSACTDAFWGGSLRVLGHNSKLCRPSSPALSLPRPGRSRLEPHSPASCSPRPEASLPLAQLETQSSARLPASTNHQPLPDTYRGDKEFRCKSEVSAIIWVGRSAVSFRNGTTIPPGR